MLPNCAGNSGAQYLPPVFVWITASDMSAPDDHFAAGPDCRVIQSGQWARWSCWWLSNYPCWDCISRRCLKARDNLSAPDDHFTASPHCRVTESGSGRVGGAGGCPTIRARIVSPAGVHDRHVPSAPDDHFTAGPHCRVTVSASGRVGGAGGRPTIRAGIVSAAGVQSR